MPASTAGSGETPVGRSPNVETKDDHPQRTVEAAPLPSKAMLEAAARYRGAWEAVRSRSPGSDVSRRDLIEMHGAALALIWATATTNVVDALALLDRLDPAQECTSA